MTSTADPLPASGPFSPALQANGHTHITHPSPAVLTPKLNGHHLINGHPSSPPLPPPHSSLILPSDWPPLTGPIDLELHDRAHASAKTEWWYLNSHVHTVPATDSSSPPSSYSFFVAFFRMAIGDNADGSFRYSHSITWALVDPSTSTYHSHATLDHRTCEALIPVVEDNTWQMDPRLNEALLEVLRKNAVPLPDRLFDAACTVGDDAMHLQYGDNSFVKEQDGYRLHLVAAEKGLELDVLLTPRKAVQRQAHDGVVKVGVKDEWMFYYFIPRMAVEGSLTLAGQSHAITGDGWYDHEFGGDLESARQKKAGKGGEEEEVKDVEEVRAVRNKSVASSMQDAKTKPNHAWNWLSLQLDNDCELTATYLLNTTTNEVVDNYAIIIHPDSTQTEHHGMSLTPLSTWWSLATTSDYPTRWSLILPSTSSPSSPPSTSLTITSVFPQQEFLTLISRPAFYEGRVDVEGHLNGQAVRGRGFVERFGFNQLSSLDGFFRRMSKLVMRSLDDYFPHHPSPERVTDLITRVDAPNRAQSFSHLMQGVNERLFYDTVVQPIRLIADRGGKSWRSYACLLCVDVVGGSSDRFKAWLPMPEIMHVGSLIIDDIQDKSLTRRGGPSCHVVFGEAVAINAGNYAYFLSPRCLTDTVTPPLTDAEKTRLYDMYDTKRTHTQHTVAVAAVPRTRPPHTLPPSLCASLCRYFFTMRIGHIGQAFDLTGMDYMMNDVVQHGDRDLLLQERIACTHRMKSAVPAGGLARMGAFVGGATEEQISRLGLYFEAVGLAFQVVDDVLNLTGFVGDTKLRGEDVMQGKVTFPIAVAMRPSAPGGEARRREIWDIVRSKTEDMAAVERCIVLVEDSGGMAGSYEYAEALVHSAWKELDPVIPDSFYKLMLRAFGIYVLQRHY